MPSTERQVLIVLVLAFVAILAIIAIAFWPWLSDVWLAHQGDGQWLDYSVNVL